MEAVEWLVNEGPRGSGRTHLLAIAFVRKALFTGYETHVWDHHYNGKKDTHLYKEIHKVVQVVNDEFGYDVLQLHVFRSSDTIRISVLPDVTQTEYVVPSIR